jgi:hypothetical protein
VARNLSSRANVGGSTAEVLTLEGAPNVSRIESSAGPQPSQCDGLAHSGKKGKNVTSHMCIRPYRQVPTVSDASSCVKISMRMILLLVLLISNAAKGQDKNADVKAKADSDAKDARLTIVVTGGEDKKPIDSASVYVRYVEEHKHGKDKKIEMNLKTNQSGVCHVPVIPPGKFVVQVIADGWKTYGEYYDVSQTEQTININLARPPKWY